MTENYDNGVYGDEEECPDCHAEECDDCDECEDYEDEEQEDQEEHENCQPGFTLEELISDANSCPTCVTEIMNALRTDCEGACQEESPGAAWLRMATSEDYMVRYLMAGSHEAPPFMLCYLSQDLCDAVRETVARNPHTPEFILAQLAQREEEFLRFAVAQNPSVSRLTLGRLSVDDSCAVVAATLLNIGCPEELLFMYAKADDVCEHLKEASIQALANRLSA